MKEIIELNTKLRKQVGSRFADEILMLGRSPAEDELKRLPAAFRAEVLGLLSAINRAVPDDFQYMVFLGDSSPDFSIEYQDGPSIAYSPGHEWRRDRSLVEQLNGFDWNAERGAAINNCQFIDHLVAESKEMEPELPTTAELQVTFKDELKAFQAKGGGDGVRVLMWRQDEGVQEERFANLETFSGELMNIMTVQLLVIGVTVDGKPLPVNRIERLKKKALDELKDMPMSYARALGKF